MELKEEEGVGRGGWDQNRAWKKRVDVGRRGKGWKVQSRLGFDL